MKVNFSNMQSLNYKLLIIILINSGFLKGTSHSNMKRFHEERNSQSTLLNDLFQNNNKNASTQAEKNGISMESSELYFISICVDEVNISRTLSYLLKVLISKENPIIFCRGLRGLINISNVENYYLWEKIPAVLDYAFANVVKPPVKIDDFENDDFLCDLMEFYPSNTKSGYLEGSLQQYIGDFIKNPDVWNKNIGNCFEQDMENFSESTDEDFLNKKEFEDINKREESKYLNGNNITRSDDCFFCISDSIDSNIDYKAIGTYIKKKISNLLVKNKPIDHFTTSLSGFKKRKEKTYEFLTQLIFDSEGFIKNDENTKKYSTMTRDDFVKNIQKFIGEKIEKIGVSARHKNERICFKEMSKSVEYIKETEWETFLKEYLNGIKNDTNRYIFLQLNKNKYDLVGQKLSLFQNLPEFADNKLLYYKLKTQKSDNYSFYTLTQFYDDFDIRIKRYIADFQQKLINMTNNFLKITNIYENNIEKTKTSSLHNVNHSKNKRYKSNIEHDDYEQNFYKNVNISILSDEDVIKSSDFLFFGIGCTYFSDLIGLTKISVNKNFIDKKIYDLVFENKTFYPFNVISRIDPEGILTKVNLNLKTDIDIHELEFNVTLCDKTISYPINDPYFLFKEIFIRANTYVNSENSRYDKFFIAEHDSMVKQISRFSMNHSDIKLDLMEYCGKEQPKNKEYYNILRPVKYTFERKFYILFYRNKNEKQEICVSKLSIERKVFIDQALEYVFCVMKDACKEALKCARLCEEEYESYYRYFLFRIDVIIKGYFKSYAIGFGNAIEISETLWGELTLKAKVKRLGDIITHGILHRYDVERGFDMKIIDIDGYEVPFYNNLKFSSKIIEIFNEKIQNWKVDAKIEAFIQLNYTFITDDSLSLREKHDIVRELNDNVVRYAS